MWSQSLVEHLAAASSQRASPCHTLCAVHDAQVRCLMLEAPEAPHLGVVAAAHGIVRLRVLRGVHVEDGMAAAQVPDERPEVDAGGCRAGAEDRHAAVCPRLLDLCRARAARVIPSSPSNEHFHTATGPGLSSLQIAKSTRSKDEQTATSDVQRATSTMYDSDNYPVTVAAEVKLG